MPRRRGSRPPAVHFMPQTNRKSVQKNLTIIFKFDAIGSIATLTGVKGLISMRSITYMHVRYLNNFTIQSRHNDLRTSCNSRKEIKQK